MIRASTFAGKAVALFGLGASGNATAAALAGGGASVAAWDDVPSARDDARAAGIDLVDLTTADWSRFSCLVLAPGVPLTHPAPHWTVERAKAAGIDVIGDIEIFARERVAHCPLAPFIAITGTNGKSTTTALVAHILREAGRDVQMGGNIGVPILSLEPPAPDRFHVIELSSFQIDLTPTLEPTVGVLLNLTPDHIERHGTFEQYAAIKVRVVAGAQAKVIGIDDAGTRAAAAALATTARVASFTVDGPSVPTARFYASESEIFMQQGETMDRIADLRSAPALQGRHNVQNALAALTAIHALQDRLDEAQVPIRAWQPDAIASALRTFPGLPHRMEEVGRSGVIRFINDSKATNADSAAKALATFGRDIFWIAGGKAKEGGIASLTPHFPAIRKAYLVGAAMDAFSATLDGQVAQERCGTIDVALSRAIVDARAYADGHASAAPIVLLSPACASYDQFRSFEHRGDAFRELVAKLPGVTRAAGQS